MLLQVNYTEFNSRDHGSLH